MERMDTIGTPRLLILGGGSLVARYYIPALGMLGWMDRCLIVDASAAAIRSLRSEYAAINVQEGDFRRMLASRWDEFDAAVVALPNHLHVEASCIALDRGLHVLCEKPLALTGAACLQLQERAEACNRVLAVAMARRLLPSVCALREALAEHMIGEPLSVDVEDGAPYTWAPDSGAFFHQENGGVLADMGIHYLDMIQELLGTLSPVAYRDDCRGGVEASAEFRLVTEEGLSVRIALSRTRLLRNRLIVRGKAGELLVEKDRFDSCEWRNFRRTLRGAIQPTAPFHCQEWSLSFESCFAEQFLRFAEAVDGVAPPTVDGREAARSSRLIEWAYTRRRPTRSAALTVTRGGGPVLAPGNAVVTGGTGFIGTHLVERLFTLALDRVTVPVRSFRNAPLVARYPVRMPGVNLLDGTSVSAAIAGARYVFHLAYGADGPHASRVTVEGTRNVIEAAIAAGAEAVVVLSTMMVFGFPESHLVDETWPYGAHLNDYARAKAQMERWCLNRAASSNDTRIAVINPICVYGPYGKTYTRMPRDLASSGSFCWIDEGSGTANYSFVDNLIDAMLLAAQCEPAHGERFLITDGATSWRQFLVPLLGPAAASTPSYTRAQLAALHRARRGTLLTAAWVALAQPEVRSAVCSTAAYERGTMLADRLVPGLPQRLRTRSRVAPEGSSTGRPDALPPLWLADLFGPTSTVFTASKARSVLGWTPRIDVAEGQNLAARWLDGRWEH